MSPFPSLSENIQDVLRFSVAYVFVLLLFLLNIISPSPPLSLFLGGSLFLMAIYYWSIYRPTLMPVWFVFVAGCIMDLLTDVPLGLNAIIFLAVRWVVSEQRRYLMSQNFVMLWLGFLCLELLVLFANWLVFSVLHTQFFPMDVQWSEFFMSVILFPIIYIVLHLTHKILPEPKSVMH